MDPQNPTTSATNPTTPATAPDGVQTTPATPASDGGIIATPAGDNTQPQVGAIDLSQFFKDDAPGTYDPAKIEALAKDRDNKAKSASYFQSELMKSNNVPKDIEGYAKTFKPDSMYEGIMDQPKIQEAIKNIREMGLKNGLSARAVNIFIDHTLKTAIANKVIDMRTPEQIQADQEKVDAEERAKLEPVLQAAKTTFDQQKERFDKFFNTPSIWTNKPEIKQALQELASRSAVGFEILMNILDAQEFGGYKALPTQAETVGVGASDFWNKYNAEQDPVKREAMLEAFNRTQPK